MGFLDLAKARYAVRKYTSQKVEKDKLDSILEAGRIAPTGANRQPQRLIVVQEQEGLEKVGQAANTYGAPLAIIVCSDVSIAWKRPYDSKVIADIDASIVTDHMMLQATELGLGSVWVCSFKPDVIKREFALPEDWEPVNILLIGYGEREPGSPNLQVKERKPLAHTVFFEKV